LLKIIQGATGNVLLTVTGDEEDAAYTAHCKKLAAGFPDNIKVVFTGGLPNHELPVLLAAHHFFALPTKGENFGHAIFEALSHGKPVLISDQTPWRQLKEQKAGWDLPLAKPDLFAKAIQQTIAMNQQEYDTWSISAWRFAKEYIERTNLIGTYKNLFN
jgi:glycosyltransferase involved in cell wall biosynthesis